MILFIGKILRKNSGRLIVQNTKGFGITNGSLIKTKKFDLTDSIAVKALIVSLFLPYPVTFATAAVLFVIIMFNKRARSLMCGPKYTVLLAVFGVLGFSVAAFYGNWLGFVALIGMLLIMILGQYLQAVMTKEIFDGAVDIICSLAPLAAVSAAVEFVVRHYFCGNQGEDIVYEFRCSGFYFNPNYLGTFAAIVATICIYRFIVDRKRRKKYVLSGICCLVCIFLSGSMFACVELAVAAIAMIIICRKWKYLLILLCCLLAASAAIYVVPALVPRLDEALGTFINRVNVWKVSIAAFKETPWFGRGLLTYNHVYESFRGTLPGVDVWPTQHAHNIMLDSLLNFGIIGAAVMWAYFANVGRGTLKALKSRSFPIESALIAGVVIGAAAHGIIDITLLWVQPGILFMFILSAGGFICRDGSCQDSAVSSETDEEQQPRTVR